MSNLKTNEVINKAVYGVVQKALAYNVNLFNKNTNGALLMSLKNIAGTFEEYLNLTLEDVLLYRDPTSTANIDKAHFNHIADNMIKIGFSTKEIEYMFAKFDWTHRRLEDAGLLIGQTIARNVLENNVKMALGTLTAVLKNDNKVKVDISATGDGKMTYGSLMQGARPFGDQMERIVAWVMHSSQAFDLYSSNLSNLTHLFNFDNIKVVRDPLGKLIVISDMIEYDSNEQKYHALGLVSGACVLGTMAEFRSNADTRNGQANILTSYQAEWSQTISLKNHRYNTETNKGIVANLSTLTNAGNWTKVSDNVKEQAGVVLITK